MSKNSLKAPEKGRGESRNIRFMVTGEFLTEHARNLVREGSFNRAMRFLLDSIIGFDDHHAAKILRGTHKLIGDSTAGDLALVADPATEEYLEDLRWMYGGILHNKGMYYRPYAWISDYGEEDVVQSGSRGYRDPGQDAGFEHRLPTMGAMSTALHKARVRVYMETPFEDIHFKLLLPLDGGHPDLNMREVLFKRVNVEVPYFIDVESDPQKVLDENWKSGILYKTGHSIKFPPKTEKEESASSLARRAVKANAGRREAEMTGMESVVAGAMSKMLAAGMDPMRVQELTGTLHKKYVMNERASTEFVSDEVAMVADHGWLSPGGRFIACQVMEHVEVATRIAGSEMAMENDGWMKLCTGNWMPPKFNKLGSKEKWPVTHAQLRFVKKWFEDRKRKQDITDLNLWVPGGA